MLEIKNLTVKVKNDTPILTDVSLSIDEGTCIGLTGASGSGKTTLIKSIMGMNSGDLEIAQGQILLDGDNLLIHGAKERRALCGKTIGFIPQNPMTAFFPHAKMERQIIETLRMHTGLDKKQAHALAENVLRQVNLTDTKRVLSAYPGELSGGMLQRIAMALILGTKPKYVLADEPTSALDEANRDLLLELLRKYQKTAAILFISHDTEAMKTPFCGIYAIDKDASFRWAFQSDHQSSQGAFSAAAFSHNGDAMTLLPYQSGMIQCTKCLPLRIIVGSGEVI